MHKELKKNLFIIGNGFDIAHGIPSKYSDFQKYIRSLYMMPELTDKSYDAFFPWKYSVPRTGNLLGHFDTNQPYKMIDVLGFLDYCISRSQNQDVPFNFYINSDWWSIEEILGKLDLKEFLPDESDEALMGDNDYEEWLIYDIAECFKYLGKLAAMWASQIDVSDVPPIEDFARLINCDRLLPINNDFFITFNYTPTLEIVYGVENVVHVHGIAGGHVMLGHASNIDVERFCACNSIPQYCRHAAETLLEVTCKETEKNASRLSEIVSRQCAGSTDIYSYGFSFAEVDLPYIALVCKALDTKSVTWHLLDFDSLERRNQYVNAIRQCGFEGRFSTYHVKTKTANQKKENPYSSFIKSKKRHMGRGRFYCEQIILKYQTINYTPTNLDMWLFLPRIVRCCFWLLVDSIKRR